MMVLPMIRIVGLSLPIMQVPHIYWFPLISIPLFAASYTLIRNQRLDRKKIGLILGNIPLQLLIALSGLVLGFIEFLILKPEPLIPTFSILPFIAAAIILLISTGFAEELLFRGILQRNAENVFGNIFGLLYASLLFTSLHIGWHSFMDLVFVFGVAMFYGYMFQKTRSLFGITLSHGLSNSVLFLIMPFFSTKIISFIYSLT
jgi:membrane protease YdiL (CAAX protease family)